MVLTLEDLSPSEIDNNRLFSRRHPFFEASEKTWRRNLSAYAGGKSYRNIALIKHLSEIDEEFAERLNRSYYKNYPRRIARLITQYVLAKRPERKGADPEIVEDSDRCGHRMDEIIRQLDCYINTCGCGWLAVDAPAFSGEKTMADELSERLRPYVYALSPLNVTDWRFASDGKLDWLIVNEFSIDDSSPFALPNPVHTAKLWTRNECYIVRRCLGNTQSGIIRHNLGVVPFVRCVEVDGYGLNANHWFDDVVSISDAIFNNESEAQMNIVKQMFGILVVPESFVGSVQTHASESNQDSQNKNLSAIISRSVALYESAEDKGISRYIKPDGSDTNTIVAMNQTLRKDLFEIVGLAVSKDSKSVESAEAKQWDFKNVEVYLQTRADLLEQAEASAWKLLNAWDPRIAIPTIVYNREFVAQDLRDDVATLTELSVFNPACQTYQKLLNVAALKLMRRISEVSQDEYEQAVSEIETETQNAIHAAQIPNESNIKVDPNTNIPQV